MKTKKLSIILNALPFTNANKGYICIPANLIFHRTSLHPHKAGSMILLK